MQGPRYRGFPAPKRGATGQRQKQFDRLQATQLYCPNCKQAVPVRERLLLVLPDGDKYEYLCARCGASVGDRVVKGDKQPLLVAPR